MVKELIIKFSNIFSKSETDIGCCKNKKLEIMRRVPMSLEKKVYWNVEDLLKKILFIRVKAPELLPRQMEI